MIFLVIVSIFNFLSMLVIGTFFFFLDKRQENFIERQKTIIGWCETLMQNQETLTKDLSKLYREIKVTQER